MDKMLDAIGTEELGMVPFQIKNIKVAGKVRRLKAQFMNYRTTFYNLGTSRQLRTTRSKLEDIRESCSFSQGMEVIFHPISDTSREQSLVRRVGSGAICSVVK